MTYPTPLPKYRESESKDIEENGWELFIRGPFASLYLGRDGQVKNLNRFIIRGGRNDRRVMGEFVNFKNVMKCVLDVKDLKA